MSNVESLYTEMLDRGEFRTVSGRVMRNLLFDGFQKLCEDTWGFLEILPLMSEAGTYEYTLSPTTSNTQVVGVHRIQKASLDSPSPEAEAAETGGSLAAGTYSYKVSAYNDDYGESLPCTAVTATISGATGVVTLTWDAIDGADGYKVYGRTSGSETLLSDQTALTYEDDGADSPGTASYLSDSPCMYDIDHTGEDMESRRGKFWRETESDGWDRVIWDGADTVRLNTIPITSNIGFQVTVALKPTARSVTIPPSFRSYEEAIKHSARAFLYGMPKSKETPWVDQRKARDYEDKYNDVMGRLKAMVMMGFAHDRTVEMRRFGA